MVIYLLAAALGLHGIVHVLGFMSTWHIGNGTAVMSPTLLAGLDPDAPLLRAVGVIWLVPLVAFVAAAAGLAFDAPWWSPLAAAAAVLSLLLCVAWWNDAKVGVAVDVVILAGLAIAGMQVRS